MKAMLKEAGITAYAALAFGGERQNGVMLPDFPYAGSFNHEILCVPTANDTIWLECTSKNDPAQAICQLLPATEMCSYLRHQAGK